MTTNVEHVEPRRKDAPLSFCALALMALCAWQPAQADAELYAGAGLAETDGGALTFRYLAPRWSVWAGNYARGHALENAFIAGTRDFTFFAGRLTASLGAPLVDNETRHIDTPVNAFAALTFELARNGNKALTAGGYHLSALFRDDHGDNVVHIGGRIEF